MTIPRWPKSPFRGLGLILALSCTMAGCFGLPPKPPDLYAVQIGPPPENYEDQIRNYFKPSLLDPYSAMYEFSGPVRGWDQDNNGIAKVFWVVCGTVNAKNRFGGYVGQRPFLAIFDRARIVFGLIGESSAVPQRCKAWYAAREG